MSRTFKHSEGPENVYPDHKIEWGMLASQRPMTYRLNFLKLNYDPYEEDKSNKI